MSKKLMGIVDHEAIGLIFKELNKKIVRWVPNNVRDMTKKRQIIKYLGYVRSNMEDIMYYENQDVMKTQKGMEMYSNAYFGESK